MSAYYYVRQSGKISRGSISVTDDRKFMFIINTIKLKSTLTITLIQTRGRISETINEKFIYSFGINQG